MIKEAASLVVWFTETDKNHLLMINLIRSVRL